MSLSHRKSEIPGKALENRLRGITPLRLGLTLEKSRNTYWLPQQRGVILELGPWFWVFSAQSVQAKEMHKNSIELRLHFPKVLNTRKVSLAVCQFHPWQTPELSCAASIQNSLLQWSVKPSNHGYSMNTYFWISLKASVLVHLSLSHKSNAYCTTPNYKHKHISHISKLNRLDLHAVLQHI